MDRSETEKYIPRLKYPDWEARTFAAVTLGRSGDVSAVPALTEALQDEHPIVRKNAAAALGRIGAIAAVDPLIGALQDEEKSVREEAVAALQGLDETVVLSGLRAALDRTPVVRVDAATALWRKMLSPMPALVEALASEERSVRAFAARALGGDDEGAAVSLLIDVLEDEDGAVRTTAVEALATIGLPVIPVLIEALKRPQATVRANASLALAAIGAPVVSPLLQAAKEGAVSEYAIGILGRLGDSQRLPRRILAEKRLSAEERIRALQALRGTYYAHAGKTVRYQFPETLALCRTALTEEDVAVREGAQTVLRWLEGDRLLVHASHPEPATAPQQLLRASGSEAPEPHPETLLRGSAEPGGQVEPSAAPHSFRGWLRRIGERLRR